ncbi:MAG: response regulator transcription factor [Saprospiraceae bacterium]|nr:response regulator transcription factor [Pyrinomonadaceae bacterium]
MKILIVDDEPLARERIREMLKAETDIESIGEATNGGDAIKKIRKIKPDVVFLDIQMPDMDGFQALGHLDTELLSNIPAIIFATAFDQHALRAFEFHALDYLLKPFDRDRFGAALTRARTQIANHQNGNIADNKIAYLLEQMAAGQVYLEWLTVKKDERIILLKVQNVHWVEAQGNYALLKFEDKSHLLRETMDNLESHLDPRTFVRIHRSTIVNVNQIKELQVWARGEYRVVTHSGKTFTLSRGYRSRFDKFLKKHSLQ